jgi:hypothetical protein
MRKDWPVKAHQRPAPRRNRAKKAARAPNSPGMDREVGFERLTWTGDSHAELSSDCETTRRSMSSWLGEVVFFFFGVLIEANL